MIGRWMRRTLALILLLAIVTALALWLFLRGSLPKLDGQASGRGLSSLVTVTRDANGVPNITGQSRLDVAFATGFVHGQERFFQMDLMRRLAAGELAELFGDKAVALDRQHRFHRFRSRAEIALKSLPPDDLRLIQRYVDGVNAGLQALAARPPEYLLTMSRPRPWSAADSLLLVWAMYFNLQGKLESREWARGWIRDHVSPEQLAFLLPELSHWDAPLDGASPQSSLVVPDQGPDWWSRPVAAKVGALSDDRVYGSNNWAIAGTRSADGRAILSNDMHLGIALPPIWYRAQLSYRDEQGSTHSVIGATLPGAPAVVVGSNGHVAWGFTNSAADTLDLVRLDRDSEHPGQVKLGDDWVRPDVHEETILVKGAAAEKMLIRETALGPLREVDGQVYAVHWVAHSLAAANLSLLAMERATSAEAALQIAAGAGMPAQNILAVDDQGHIGWTIAGALPERERPGPEASFPLAPDQIASSWHDVLAPDRHPRLLDPVGGQLQTANSRQLLGAGSAEIGDGGFDLGARTQQIRDDLRGLGNGVDVKSAYGVMLDDRALFIDGWRKRALAVLDDQAVSGYPQRAEFKRLLTEGWDGRASTQSVGYRLARGFLYSLYDECFATLNESLAKLDQSPDYRDATHRWPVVIEALLNKQPAAWLPPGRKDWRDVQLAAIDKTIAGLTETGGSLAAASWGNRNRARIAHPFAKVLPLLKGWLSAPEDELAGDSNMPRVAAPDFGPSERLTVAPGKEESGIFNMPGGQSGHPLSPFFLAGHRDWVEGKPTPLLPGAPKYGLVLTPG